MQTETSIGDHPTRPGRWLWTECLEFTPELEAEYQRCLAIGEATYNHSTQRFVFGRPLAD